MEHRITIIDDDLKDINKVTDIIKGFNNADTTFMMKSYTDASRCNAFDDDIYILDIDMPDEDGFHLARRITTSNLLAKIIFCTSHNDFVYSSFALNTFYFVRKSNLKEDLTNAIRKYLNTLNLKYYVFKKSNIPDKILLDEILYIEPEGNYIHIHTVRNEDYHDRCSLRSLRQNELSDAFLKVSSSYIVNMKHISSIDEGNIHFVDSTHIPFSKNKYKEIKMKWNSYLVKVI